ncbi:MAG: hypothetical protein KDC57_23855, partial [Saprospiraceae bacterium]|nr:hypothetical protein [Saprospiraceae bacterium]
MVSEPVRKTNRTYPITPPRIFNLIGLIASLILSSAGLLAQPCATTIDTTSTPMQIPLGGKLPFFAVGSGGSGSCKLQLEIQPVMGMSWQFIASVSGGPGKTLSGSTTFPASQFPAGNYTLLFSYGCDGMGCIPDSVRVPLQIVATPGIINDRVTEDLCLGGRLDFFAEAFGGMGNCRLGIEIRAFDPGNTQPFTFLASVSGTPNLKLAGSTTLPANIYPVGDYEVRLFYECGPDAMSRTLVDDKVILVTVHPFPQLLMNANLDDTICSGEIFHLPGLFADLPAGYTMQFKDNLGNLIDTNQQIFNFGRGPIVRNYSLTPYSCIPPVCITDFRVGGQTGDNYIGPTCNGNGTFRSCFYVTGRNLPENLSLYSVEINGQSFPAAFLQKLQPNLVVVCFSSLAAMGPVTVNLIIANRCSLEIPDLFTAPDCTSPANCLTDFRIGGQTGDNYIGPVCNDNGTYRTCFYLNGPNLPNDINAYNIEINGKLYPNAFFVRLTSTLAVICATNIQAVDSADVTISVNGLCNLTKLKLYEEPDCALPADCITNFRLGGQPGDSYIGPTCNTSGGTYRTAFYINGTALPNNMADYEVIIDGNSYTPAFFTTINATQVVVGVTNIPATGMPVDVIINIQMTCSDTIMDMFTEPNCPAPLIAQDPVTAKAPGDEFTNVDPFCCPGPVFTLRLTVFPEPVIQMGQSLTDTVCSHTAFSYDLRDLFQDLEPGFSLMLTDTMGNRFNPVIDSTVMNNGADPLTLSYTLIPSICDQTSMQCCPGDTFTFSITILPAPKLAANDRITLSLGSNCERLVRPGDLLNSNSPCVNNLEVKISYPPGTTHFDPPNRVDATHRGYPMTFQVYDLDGVNRTWGTLVVEDKLAPIINCQDDTLTCFEVSLLPSLEELAESSDNCGLYPVQIQILSSTWEDYQCEDRDFTGKITRVIRSSDAWGNHHECIQELWIERNSLDSLICPDTIELECTTLELYRQYGLLDSLANELFGGKVTIDLDALDPFTLQIITRFLYNTPIQAYPEVKTMDGGTSPIWLPELFYQLLPGLNNDHCNLMADYQDQVFDVCGNARKIRRMWNIYDWCGHRDTTCEQWIIVKDTIPPFLNFFDYFNLGRSEMDTTSLIDLANQFTVLAYTEPHDCKAHVHLPDVKQYFFDCSDFEVGYEVEV